MFTVYIDDSGTDPNQKVVVAAAMVVPASKIASLNREWTDFDKGYKFGGDLHCSECAAKNKDSVFANWSDRKIRNALRRARSIMKRHASVCVSFTIHKDDFTAETPPEWLQSGGKDPFTWALRSLLNVLRVWPGRIDNLPFEYVIDWMERREQNEVDMLMAQMESAFPGQYEGHYSFRKRSQIPPL